MNADRWEPRSTHPPMKRYATGAYVRWADYADAASALATIRTAAREYFAASDAIDNHPGALDSSGKYAAEMDALFTIRDEKAARLRAVASPPGGAETA